MGGANICLESVVEEEDDGVRKVLHMGDGDIMPAPTHIVVDESTMQTTIDSECTFETKAIVTNAFQEIT